MNVADDVISSRKGLANPVSADVLIEEKENLLDELIDEATVQDQEDVFEEKENRFVEFNGSHLKIKDSFVKLLKKTVDSQKTSENVGAKINERHIEFEDSSDLPEGWTRYKKFRINSKSLRPWDRIIQSPDGTKFDRPSKIDRYLVDNNIDIVINFNPVKPLAPSQSKSKEIGSFKNQLINKFAVIKNNTMGQILPAKPENDDGEECELKMIRKDKESINLPEIGSDNVGDRDVKVSESVAKVTEDHSSQDFAVKEEEDGKDQQIMKEDQKDELKRKVPNEFISSPKKKKPNIVGSLTDLDKKTELDLELEKVMSSESSSSKECNICGVSFQDHWKRERHKGSHFKDSSMMTEKCEVCSLFFKNQEILSNHTSLHHAEKVDSVIIDSSNPNNGANREPEESCEDSSESELNSTLKSNCDAEGVNICEVSDEMVEEEETEASDLPEGWVRIEIPKAFSKKDLIVVVQSPDGKQFDSQKKLNSYIARNKMPFKIDINGPFQKFETKVDDETEDNVERSESNDDLDSYYPNKKNEKTKKEKTVETDRSLTNQDIDEEEDTNFTSDELKYIEDIDKFLKETNLNLKASPATKGDGNCWFRALADQVVLHDLQDKARNHRSLRLEVCDHTKKLPEDIVDNLVNVLWSGRKKNLRDLACRQRKAGQWVDNTGIMVLTTAHYLGRNIHLYSYPHQSSSSLFSLTKIDAGPEADNHPPLTVFFYDRHYQTLQKDNDVGSDSSLKDSCKTEVSDDYEETSKIEENSVGYPEVERIDNTDVADKLEESNKTEETNEENSCRTNDENVESSC